MKLFELFATLGLDTSGFDKGVQGAQGKMTSLASTAGKAVEGVGKGALSIGKAAASAAGSIIDTMENALKTIGTIGGGAMIALGTQAVSAAADIAAENAAFSATFGEMADEAKSAYAIIGEQANILDTRLQKTATKGFSQLKGAGMNANEALEASARLLNLAADGAAYYDRSLEDTDERLRSFLRGNVEAGDSIGLFTSELQRNNKAVDLYGKKWDKLTESQRQMVMLNIAEEIYKQSGVIGQAARESEGWANVIGNLQEAWRQTLGVIGTPIMDALTPVIQNLTTFLVEHKGDLEGFATQIGDIITMLTTGREEEAISAASGMINGFLDAINTKLSEGEMWEKGDDIFRALMDGFDSAIDHLKPSIETLAGKIGPWIVEYNSSLLLGGLELIKGIADGVVANRDQLGMSIGEALGDLTAWIDQNGASIVEGAIRLVGTIGEAVISNAPSLLYEAGKAIVEGLFSAFSSEEAENPLVAEIDEAYTEMWNLEREIDATRSQYTSMMETEQARYELAQKHLSTIEAISNKEIKTDEDMLALQDAVAALNTLYPDLNASINEQTGKLNESTTSIRANIDALHELAIEQAAQYQTQQFNQQIGPAMEKKIQADKNASKAAEELSVAQSELNTLLALQPEPDGKWATEYNTLDGLVLKSIEGLDEYYQFAADGSAKIKDEYVGLTGEITQGAAIQISALVQAAADEAQKLVDELEEAKASAEETADKANAAVETIIAEYQGNMETLRQMLDQATSSIEEEPDVSGIENAADSVTSVLEKVNTSAQDADVQVKTTLESSPNSSGISGAAESASGSLHSLMEQAYATAAAINAAFSSGGGKTSSPGSGFFQKHAATGLERIPYDGFPAILHKDEMVLDRKDANAYRNGDVTGQERGNVTVNQYISAVPQTPSELAFVTANALEMLRFNV